MTEAVKPKKWGRIITNVILGCFAFSVFSVVVHRFVPVSVTSLMVSRLFEGEGLDARWRPAAFIDDDLKTAVIAAEDAKFCSHDGFDFEAIKKAQRYNRTHKKQRGASTLSQQTAKNAFLWSQRSYVRKGFEVYYTFLIEQLWPKSRIIGVYLNIAEWGPGVYGAEAASHYWFGKSAGSLTDREAAHLAAILPSPRKWKAAGSGRYVNRRSGKIVANANVVERGGINECAVD
jgi:monofunctional biosynthetic peptidoglycan transglycosylase